MQNPTAKPTEAKAQLKALEELLDNRATGWRGVDENTVLDAVRGLLDIIDELGK